MRPRLRAGLTRTTGFQLTLLYAALSTTTLGILLGFVYWSSIGLLSRQTDATIEAEIQGLAEHYRRTGLRGLTRVIGERIGGDPSRRNFYLFTDAAQQPLAGNLTRWPRPQPAGDGWLEFAQGGAIVRARYYVLQGSGGLGLLVGRDVRELLQMRALFERALLVGIAITLLLSLAGGALLSLGLLRRVDAITRTVRRVMDGDLSQRIPARGSGDEFDQLAEHLNAMLARIEQLMASVRLVGDNIAHDLRTPLTRLRNRLESLSGADAATMRDGIEAGLADADQLLSTFQALLRITRLRSGTYATTLAPVDLGALAADAAELYLAVAEERRIGLCTDLAAGVLVAADRDLLFQAIANLLDNAIKYTPSGGRIELTVSGTAAAASPARVAASGPRARICVRDTGPGIPGALRDRVFEPFFRLDESRSAPGNGLGLALVKAIADHHHAAITLDDAAPGLRACIEFPRLPSTAPPAYDRATPPST
jgi:signal transduction histidine kinase